MMISKRDLIGFSTIIYVEVRRFLRVWIDTLLPPAITSILYFVIFGGLIGPRLGDVEGFKYMQYIAPGLIMMNVISGAYLNVGFSFYLAKFQRSIEEILVSPLPSYLLLLGYVVGGCCRGIIIGILVSTVALFFTHLQVHHFGIIVGMMILTSALFSLGGFLNGVFAKSFDGISLIPTFVLTPLTYLGGVFYSIKMLSPFWQTVSLANPVLYIVDGFRYGILGISDVDVKISLGMLSILVITLFLIALYIVKKGIGIRT